MITLGEKFSAFDGEIELIGKDRHGNVIDYFRDHNEIKIFAKEILAHRLPHSKVWDPTASSGGGAWVASGIDPDEDFAAKYILFGASFDDDGAPLDTADTRYYVLDVVTGGTIPVTMEPGAYYGGGLINAIPIAEPDRPLKKIERIYYTPSYQPAGTPLLQEDVRAINNIVVMETVLRQDEYNGFGITSSDYFTITEVALAAGKEIVSASTCDTSPNDLFLEGPILINAAGTATVTVDPSDIALVDTIVEGDQVKITTSGSIDVADQVNPYYLVIDKAVGGSDIVLDRIPVDSDGNALTGQFDLYRSTLRIFSHRILPSPFKKSSVMELTVRWKIRFS